MAEELKHFDLAAKGHYLLHGNTAFSRYLSADSKFSVECYGGELLAMLMALKMFSQLDELPKFVIEPFENLVKDYKRKVIEQYPGMQLIDFDDPAKYFMSLLNAEQDVKMDMAIVKLDNIFELIQQQVDEASQ